MEQLGTAVHRVLADLRDRMDGQTGAGVEARPGKVAPGGVARGEHHEATSSGRRMPTKNETPYAGGLNQMRTAGPEQPGMGIATRPSSERISEESTVC